MQLLTGSAGCVTGAGHNARTAGVLFRPSKFLSHTCEINFDHMHSTVICLSTNMLDQLAPALVSRTVPVEAPQPGKEELLRWWQKTRSA